MQGWLTPDAAGGSTVCRVLVIPIEYLASVDGALEELTETFNWEAYGSATIGDATDLMRTMVDDYYDSTDGSCP